MTYRNQYINEMNQMDKNGNGLTAEHIDYIKKEYVSAKIDLGEEEALYFLAIDFNVIVTVIKQIVKGL